MTFEQLKDILVEQGWKIYKDTSAADYRYKYYAARRPKYSKYDCTCNDKPPLFWVRFSNMNLIFPWAADAIRCEVEISGQVEGELWPRIQVDVSPWGLIDLKEFDKIERTLCSAWNSINGTYHVSV